MSGWAGGGRHAAKPLGGRSGERRQVPPHGAEAPGSASAALTVRAPALRRGGGDVPGGQGREMGQLGGLGCRAPLLAALRARGRGPGSSFRAGVVCLAVQCRGAGDVLLWHIGCSGVHHRAKAVSSFGVQGLKPAG